MQPTYVHCLTMPLSHTRVVYMLGSPTYVTALLQ